MEWWELLIQQIINGLTLGSVLALVALGYTMVYGIIELINFAHGDVFMWGMFISLTLFTALGVTATVEGFQLIWVLLIVFAITICATAIINMTIDRVAYRPLRKAPRLAPLISAIGMSFVLENLAMLWKGPAPVTYPAVIPNLDIPAALGMQSNILFGTKDLFVIAVAVPLMIGLRYFVAKTKMGRAMRATAQDRETASIMGINVEQVIMVTFLLGGALAGAAGVIHGMYYNIGQWWVGYNTGLKAFTAAVLGGIGNIGGAMLGGMVIGFLTAFSDQYLATRWTNAVVFMILILVLVFRPAGLLGEATGEKA